MFSILNLVYYILLYYIYKRYKMEYDAKVDAILDAKVNAIINAILDAETMRKSFLHYNSITFV